MKKIYKAPICELQPTVDTEIFCASPGIEGKGLSDGLDITWGGTDTEKRDADANEFVWDHFDNGLK